MISEVATDLASTLEDEIVYEYDIKSYSTYCRSLTMTKRMAFTVYYLLRDRFSEDLQIAVYYEYDGDEEIDENKEGTYIFEFKWD